MRTMRITLLFGCALALCAACGGSGTGDVTIATDDPPANGKSAPTRAAATEGTPTRAPAH